ncbi:IQ domain-containing protein G-like, partial [Asbolus verrucosus]
NGAVLEYSNEEVKFVKRWQYARHEQNRLRLKKKESDYYNTTINMQWEMELEKRCHKEFEEYIVESQKDYMDEIQNWMDQYETDLENRETDIFNLKMEVEQLIDKQEVMKAEYEERAQAIEQWLEYKRKKQEAEERMALETWAACKIQLSEYAYAEVAFVKKWEGARMEQNSMVLRRNEHSFRSTTTNMENEMNLETRVHDQLKKYLTEAEQDYYNEIERWMEVYDREFEDREMDIYQLKHRTDMLLDKKENLQTKYDERAQEMKDWIEYKRRKKEQEERLALETWATHKG